MRIKVVVSRPTCHGNIDFQQRLPSWIWFVDVSYFHLPNLLLRPLILGFECRVSQQRLARPISFVSGLPARCLAGKQPGERTVRRCAEVIPNPHSDPSLRPARIKVRRALREQIHTADGRVAWNLLGNDRTHRKQRLVFAVQCVNQIPKSRVHFSASNGLTLNRERREIKLAFSHYFHAPLVGLQRLVMPFAYAFLT